MRVTQTFGRAEEASGRVEELRIDKRIDDGFLNLLDGFFQATDVLELARELIRVHNLSCENGFVFRKLHIWFAQLVQCAATLMKCISSEN